MKKKLFLIITSLLFIEKSTNAQTSEENLVKEAFQNYKSAILNDKGDKALNSIDSRTTKYYSDILYVIKNSDSTQVDAMSLIDKITIFSIRHRASKEEIIAMSGNDLFVYAIKNGLVGKNSVVNNTIGEVTIEGTFAKGQLVVSGKPAPLYFHFYKESDQWKLDLTSLFPLSNILFKQMVEESGENENEYLFNLLEMLTGKKPGQEIWKKIN